MGKLIVLASLVVVLSNSICMATSMPSSDYYCVWRPSAPSASGSVSDYFTMVMDEWNYRNSDYIETQYGFIEATDDGPVVHEPGKCKIGSFLDEIGNNNAVFFFASHALYTDMVLSVYFSHYDAETAADILGSAHSLPLVAVPVLPAPLWGIKLNASEVDQRCNAQIVVDMGCYNRNRRNFWGSCQTFLGHDQDELGPTELVPQLTSFFSKLRYFFSPEDIFPFPEEFKHSFAEADALVDTLTVFSGGDVVLGPTFIPWESKHDERDGPGSIDVIFDLNLPCQGDLAVECANSDSTTVTHVGFNGDGNLLIRLAITGAGWNAITCFSHSITNPQNSGIYFNGGGGFSIQFSVDTTPMAGIEDFYVQDGKCSIRVSKTHNTAALIIEGSDDDAGPFTKLARVENEDVNIGLTTVNGLPFYEFYRLRELETDGNLIDHMVVCPSLGEPLDETEHISQSDVTNLFINRLPRERTDTPETMVILAPSSMTDAVTEYIHFWSIFSKRVDVRWIDSLWGGTNDSDVFRANEKILIEELVSEGYDKFLLIGDASDSQEIQIPWPQEYGWEDCRQEMLAGNYTPQPEKNIHPSPVYWYDPVLSQDSGVNLPYFFSDWLLLDLDGDDFPDPGLIIGRLPFTEEWQLWAYLYKLVELVWYGLPDVPINTLALVGDINHAGEFDGIHAVSVMEDHLELIDWPVFPMLESEYGSELSRSYALKTAWQNPNQYWNFVVMVASYSTRYRLGNWITMAFNLDNMVPQMTHSPFMFLNSCTTGNYWWTENGGTKPRVEYLLEHSRGASGIFAHSDGSWQEPNRDLGNMFLANVQDNSGQSWGVSAAQAVQSCKSLGRRERINALRSVFLSDPLLVPLAYNPEPEIVTNVTESHSAVTRLVSSCPNPFNPITTISYEVGKEGTVEMVVYDIKGMLVNTLICEHQLPGCYQVVWNGTDFKGRTVSSGLYFCRMVVGGFTSTTKITLTK